jgi:hypothetical protein
LPPLFSGLGCMPGQSRGMATEPKPEGQASWRSKPQFLQRMATDTAFGRVRVALITMPGTSKSWLTSAACESTRKMDKCGSVSDCAERTGEADAGAVDAGQRYAP